MSTAFKYFRLYKFVPAAVLCSAPFINHVTDFNNNKKVEPIDVVQVQKEPITVLHFEKSGTFSNSSKVVWDVENFTKILDKVGDQPLVIVSINGRKRTGKSTALNHILRFFDHNYGSTSLSEDPQEKGQTTERSKVILKPKLNLLTPLGKSGFPVGDSLDVVTKGILIWPEPFFLTHKTGLGKEVKFAVILMDTQGLHDPETTEQENAVLFSFASFCSSVMIYNVKDMDDDSLQHLNAFITYSKGLQKGGWTPDKFIILQRDFHKPDSFVFGLHTVSLPKDHDKNYWHHVLGTDVRGQLNPRSMSSENRDLRNDLRNTFGEIEIFLLPPPGNTFMRNPHAAVTSRHPEYMEYLTHLTNFVQHVSAIPHLATVVSGTSHRTGCQEVMTGHSLKKKFQWTWAGLQDTTEFHPLKTITEYYKTAKIYLFKEGALKKAKEIDGILGLWKREKPYGLSPEDCQKWVDSKIVPFWAQLLGECAILGVGVQEERKMIDNIDSAFKILIEQTERLNADLWEKYKWNRWQEEISAQVLTTKGRGIATAGGVLAVATLGLKVGLILAGLGLGAGYGFQYFNNWSKKSDIEGSKPLSALEIFHNQLYKE